MKSRVKWLDNMSFVGESASGHSIVMDGPPEFGGRNLGVRPMEMLLLVTDILDAVAGNLLDPAQIFIQPGFVRQTNLAADDNTVSGRKCFAGNAGFRFFGQKGIQHSVRNAVAQLVGVTFGNGFRGEGIVLTGHE